MEPPKHVLVNVPGRGLVTLTRYHVERIGALILSTLDRLAVPNQDFSRIVIYGRRVIAFDLPWLPFDRARDLLETQRLGERLDHLIGPQVMALRERTSGCVLIVDLLGDTTPQPSAPRQTRTSLEWCSVCDRLMPYGHSH